MKFPGCLVALVSALAAPAGVPAATFYDNVLPVLQKHCQGCHQSGEIGPMPLITYRDVRPWAAAIREAVKLRQMPPWFADPQYGEFANDSRLSEAEIREIAEWADAGAPEGTPPHARRTPPQVAPAAFQADLVLSVPAPIPVPANSDPDYVYVVLPLPFTLDRWVRGVEIRPSDRGLVHHAVLYVRERGSAWLREAQPGVPYTPSRSDPEAIGRSRATTADILAIYAPGSPVTICPEGMAKKIPAGSDLVLQFHYTSRKTAGADQTQVGLALMSEKPRKRILTLQMGRDDLRIPPGDSDYRASVSGTLPGDALLLSLFPHMHLRGSAFDFEIAGENGHLEKLLRVKPYRFNWQMNYVLKKPRPLAKGTVLRWTGYFDNSANNPFNPDPTAEVTWGEHTREEMMIGFFDVAVEPEVDKQRFFAR